jgi:hypothetical protein
VSTLKTIKLQNPSGASSNIDLGVGGEVLIGSASTTGTASQTLQVTGGAYVSGSLGVGVTNPSEKFHVSGGNLIISNTIDQTPNSSFDGHLKINGNGYNGGISLDSTGLWLGHNSAVRNIIFAPDETERVRITPGGSVGIGTNNPGAELDVVGTGFFRTFGAGGAILRITSSGSINYIQSGTSLTADSKATIIFSSIYGVTEYARFANTASGTYFKASDDGSYYSSPASYHEFRNSTNNDGLVKTETNASYTAVGLREFITRANTTAYYFYEARSGGTADIEFILRGDGQAYADGSWNGGGADYAEMFEWEDGNINNEDRVGYTVSLVGNKIKIAEEGDEVIGVISGNPSVLGDTAWNKWTEKYLKDEFNRYIFEEHNVVEWTDEDGKNHSYEDWNLPEDVTVPADATIKTHDDKGNRFTHRKLNPEYNPDQEYVSREDRPEWDAVGLVGKLRVRKGQVIGSRWIKMQDISENVEEWLVR